MKAFLDTEVYIKNNKLYTKRFIGKKQTKRVFAHLLRTPNITEKQHTHSQVLRVKRTCSTMLKTFNKLQNFKKKKVAEKGYKPGLLDKHISTVEKLDENEML